MLPIVRPALEVIAAAPLPTLEDAVVIGDWSLTAMGKKQLADLIDACYRQGGQKKTVLLADQLRTQGYKYATMAGISIFF
jgi:methylmalonyl-CoA mutase cobalamin-binding subunit